MASLLINIDVPDLERAITFYTRAFDLRLGRRLGTDFAELLGGDAPIYLLQQPSGTAPHRDAHATRSYARHWTPVHLDFVVQDLASAVTRAEQAVAARESDVRAMRSRAATRPRARRARIRNTTFTLVTYDARAPNGGRRHEIAHTGHLDCRAPSSAAIHGCDEW